MQEIQTILLTATLSILTALTGLVVKEVRRYLVTKGGEKAVKIVEIVARNAVNAVEQIARETGWHGASKLRQAKLAISEELAKYNISMTDQQLDTFVEAAVKQMNDNWKGDKNENS